MAKAIGLAVLVAFVFALPFVNVSISRTTGHAIAMLDVCSPDAPGTTAETTTIAEPAFDVPLMMPVSYLPVEKTFMPDLTFFSPIDKPPVS